MSYSPRNFEYLKVKEIVENYFDNLKQNKSTENSIIKLKDCLLPLDQFLLLIKEKYEKTFLKEINQKLILKEGELERSYKEFEEENLKKEDKINKLEETIKKIERSLKKTPLYEILAIINNPLE